MDDLARNKDADDSITTAPTADEPGVPAAEAEEAEAALPVDGDSPPEVGVAPPGEEGDALAQPEATAAREPLPDTEQTAPDTAATAPEASLPEAPDTEPTTSAPASEVAEPAPEEPDGEMSMMELLLEGSEYLPGQVQAGDLVEGTVVRKDKEQIVLDIGTKQQAVVPISDIVRLPRDYVDALHVGQPISVVVVRPDWREGEILVSAYQARTMVDWERAQKLMDSGEILELRVVGFNKGGVLLEFGQLQGFVPRSHLAGAAGREETSPDVLGGIVGTSLPVRVIEVSRRRRRLIMSHRQAIHEWRAERKRSLMDELKEGTVRRGVVSSVADFGAFVDLGGADGLVHVSELTHERGKHPRDVVRVGQEVDVYVLSVDRERGRIGLSLKRLAEDPWAIAEQEHYVGELVEVSISNLTKFGAFARLDDGLEGLIHISELSDTHIESPREIVRPGQRVTVEIIALDARRQRIGLSIRRVPEHLRQPLSELLSEVTEQPDSLPAEPEPAAVTEPEPAVEDAWESAAEPGQARDAADTEDEAVQGEMVSSELGGASAEEVPPSEEAVDSAHEPDAEGAAELADEPEAADRK